MPTDDIQLPSWADSFSDTWHELFWHQDWKDEDSAIATLELEMKEARYSYIKEGMVLKAFQHYKWYIDKGFKTFKDYCEKSLKKPYFYVKRTITAAQVAWSLLLEGFVELPDNISQAQRLRKSARQVSEECDETVSCWEKVLESAKTEGKGLTANYIEKTITGEVSKPMANAQIPREDWDRLAKKAKGMGKPTQELLRDLIRDYLGDENDSGSESDRTEPDPQEKVEEVAPEKLEFWSKENDTLVRDYFETRYKNYDTT